MYFQKNRDYVIQLDICLSEPEVDNDSIFFQMLEIVARTNWFSLVQKKMKNKQNFLKMLEAVAGTITSQNYLKGYHEKCIQENGKHINQVDM